MMKKMARIISLFCVVASLASTKALAQTNYYDDAAKAQSMRKINSAESPMLNRRGFDTMFNRDLSTLEPNAEQFCQGPGCAETMVMPTPNPGQRSRSISPSGPLRVHAEGMMGNAYKNQQFTYLSSPWVIADVTFNQLDAGVFGGMNSAYMKDSLAQVARYQAEASMFNQLNFVPDVREVVSAGYLSCLEQNGGGVMAMDICLEDSPSPTTLAFDFSGGGLGSPTWLAAHPDRDPTMMGPPNPNLSSIFLTDLLLEPSRQSGMNPGDVNYLKTSFRELFGDKTFTLERPNAGVPSKQLRIQITAPTKAPSEHERDIHNFTWRRLHELMRAYCEHKNSMLQGSVSSYNPFQININWLFGWIPIPTPQNEDFWRRFGQSYGGAQGPTTSTYVDLSTSTFEFTPVIGDALFSLFERTQEIKDSSTQIGELDCDVLRSANTGDASFYPNLAEDPTRFAKDWRRMFDRVVKIITAGKRFQAYLQAMRWVNQQTPSSADGDLVREHAFSLIRAVSVIDPEEAEVELAEVSGKFLQELMLLKQAEVGKLGNRVSDTFSQESGSSLASGGPGQ